MQLVDFIDVIEIVVLLESESSIDMITKKCMFEFIITFEKPFAIARLFHMSKLMTQHVLCPT